MDSSAPHIVLLVGASDGVRSQPMGSGISNNEVCGCHLSSVRSSFFGKLIFSVSLFLGSDSSGWNKAFEHYMLVLRRSLDYSSLEVR